MTEPTGGSSLPSSPDLVTNSDAPLPAQDTTFFSSTDPISTPDRRQLSDSLDSLITEIIQTVSLVHYVSRDGTPISIKTLYSDPSTVLVDPVTGERVELVTGDGDGAESAVPTPAANDDTAPSESNPPESKPDLPDIPLSILDTLLEPTETGSPSAALPSDDLSTSPSVSISSTATDFTSVFPTLPPSLIASAGFRNLSHHNATRSMRLMTSRSSTLWTSESDSNTRTKPTNIAAETAFPVPGGLGGGAPVNDANVAQDDPPTPTSTVVGSVVGSVAGAALIVFVIMALLRWRKRQSGRERLGDGPSTTDRGLFIDGAGSGGGGGGDQAMAQRSLPFAIPAVLASLSSHKSQSSPGKAGSVETGFYRVSGKKLPSVLQYGGDGFSDPRASAISGTSSQYPDSQPDGTPAGLLPRFALGNPMRPVSGVPVFRSSPARTPVTEHNPFADPFMDPPSPPRSLQPNPPSPARSLRPDAVGRTLTGQDVSRVSSSKFVEDV